MRDLFFKFGSDDLFIKFLFDHLRNLGISMVFLGASAWRFSDHTVPTALSYPFATVLGVVGLVLTALNLTHGLVKMREFQYSKPIAIALVVVYAVAAGQLVTYTLQKHS